MNHEVTIYKHNDQTQTYQRYRSEWVTDKDLANLKLFVSLNTPIDTFYQYKFDGVSFNCLHPDLVEWVRYLAARQLLKERAIKEGDINIIEQ